MLQYPKEALLYFLQDIVPHSSSGVVKLFVPPSEIEVKKREAEALPKLNTPEHHQDRLPVATGM